MANCCAVNNTVNSSEKVKLFIGCQNGQIMYLEGAPFKDTGRAIDTIPGFVTSMAFDTERNRLMAAGKDGHVYMYDTESLEKVGSMQLHEKTIYELKLFEAGGEAYMATCSQDNKVKTWKLDDTSNGFTIVNEIGQGAGSEEYDALRAFVGMTVATIGGA